MPASTPLLAEYHQGAVHQIAKAAAIRLSVRAEQQLLPLAKWGWIRTADGQSQSGGRSESRVGRGSLAGCHYWPRVALVGIPGARHAPSTLAHVGISADIPEEAMEVMEVMEAMEAMEDDSESRADGYTPEINAAAGTVGDCGSQEARVVQGSESYSMEGQTGSAPTSPGHGTLEGQPKQFPHMTPQGCPDNSRDSRDLPPCHAPGRQIPSRHPLPYGEYAKQVKGAEAAPAPHPQRLPPVDPGLPKPSASFLQQCPSHAPPRQRQNHRHVSVPTLAV